MKDEKKKRKKKFSFLRAIGMVSDNSKEPTVANAANTLSSHKKMMAKRMKELGY